MKEKLEVEANLDLERYYTGLITFLAERTGLDKETIKGLLLAINEFSKNWDISVK